MLECNDDHKLCMNRDAQRIFGTRKFSSLLYYNNSFGEATLAVYVLKVKIRFFSLKKYLF